MDSHPPSRLRIPRPRKRTLLMVLLLLTSGAIINVAVAWGIVKCEFRQTASDYLSVHAKELLWERHDARACLSSFGPDWAGERAWRFGSTEDTIKLNRSTESWMLIDFSYGLPTEALRGTFSYYETLTESTVDLHDYVRSPFSSAPVPGTPVLYLSGFLPTKIIWPGFAINTIFYAAILWALLAAPFVLRRKRRIKRRQCPACAYPVGVSDVCTECGAAVRSASTSSSSPH